METSLQSVFFLKVELLSFGIAILVQINDTINDSSIDVASTCYLKLPQYVYWIKHQFFLIIIIFLLANRYFLIFFNMLCSTPMIVHHIGNQVSYWQKLFLTNLNQRTFVICEIKTSRMFCFVIFSKQFLFIYLCF